MVELPPAPYPPPGVWWGIGPSDTSAGSGCSFLAPLPGQLLFPTLGTGYEPEGPAALVVVAWLEYPLPGSLLFHALRAGSASPW